MNQVRSLNIALLILGVQFLFFNQKYYASPIIGLFLTPITKTETGFLVLGVEVSKTTAGKQGFLAQELRYNQLTGWQEHLYFGHVSEVKEGLSLVPESCQVRANLSFSQKKGLLRRFDCKHLEFILAKHDDYFQISSTLNGTLRNQKFSLFFSGLTGEPIAISFLLPDQPGEEGVWGFHLNGIGNKNPVQIWSQNRSKWEPFHNFLKPSLPGIYEVYRWKRTFSD